MKKILALVLALVMVLSVASVMAEGSKTLEDTQKTTVTNTVTNYYNTGAVPAELPSLNIVSTPSAAIQAIIEQFKAAHDAGNDLSALPDDVKAQIADGLNKINEMVAAKFSGNTNVAKEVEIVLSLMTKYTDQIGEEVAVLIGELDGENVKWTVLKGQVNNDGDIVVKVPAELVKGIKDNEFIIAVVSK